MASLLDMLVEQQAKKLAKDGWNSALPPLNLGGTPPLPPVSLDRRAAALYGTNPIPTRTAAPQGLDSYGDAGWETLVPDPRGVPSALPPNPRGSAPWEVYGEPPRAGGAGGQPPMPPNSGASGAAVGPDGVPMGRQVGPLNPNRNEVGFPNPRVEKDMGTIYDTGTAVGPYTPKAEVDALYAAQRGPDGISKARLAGLTAAGIAGGAGLLGISGGPYGVGQLGPEADLSSPVPGEEQPLHSPVPVDLTTPEGLRAEIQRKKDQLSRDTGKSIKDLEKQTTDAIASTIPEEQKEDFFKSINGLDLLTFSMALLANNNGEINAGQNVGLAFQAALKQKEGRDQLAVENKFKDRAAATDEERAAAATTGAGAAVLNAETKAKYTPVGLKIDQQNADAATMRAQADMVAAAQGTTGSLAAARLLVGGPMNASQMSEATAVLGQVLGSDYKLNTDPKKGRVGDIALAEALAQAYASERALRVATGGPALSNQERLAIAQKVAEPVIAAGVTTDGWGWSTTPIEPSMLNGGYTSANPGPRVPQPSAQSAKAARLAEIERQLANQ